MPQPDIKKTISGYTLDFQDDKVFITVSRVREEHGVIKGDVSLLLGEKRHQEPAFNFNFSSDTTRKRLVNTLNEKYLNSNGSQPQFNWLIIIDELCRQVQKMALQGEQSTLIKPTVLGIKHPGYYVEPVIMRGVPNVIYGEKGTNKTTISLTMLGLIACGQEDSETGLIGVRGKVAILDWENNAELTDYTLSRLVEGGAIPYYELPYLRCIHPLADDIERIGAFLDDCQADVVLVDSLGQAAGTDQFDSAGKRSALRFFEAWRQLNRTVLIIGQTSKDEGGKKSIYGSTFFRYYSRNIFRIQENKDKSTEDEMVIALIHEDANFSKKYPPIGFRLTYTDETISIAQEEVSISQFMERANQTMRLMNFLKDGPKTVQAIMLELDTGRNNAQKLLSTLKKRTMVVNLGSGLWGSVSPIIEDSL